MNLVESIASSVSLKIHRIASEGELVYVEEEHYGRIGGADPSPEYSSHTYTQTSAVPITEESRLRMLEREDVLMFFCQKPEKCDFVRKVGDPSSINNPNNILLLSRYLHQQTASSSRTILFHFKYS